MDKTKFITDLTDDVFISYLIDVDISYLMFRIRIEPKHEDIITVDYKQSLDNLKNIRMSTLDIPVYIFEQTIKQIKYEYELRYDDFPMNKKYTLFTKRCISDLSLYLNNYVKIN